MLILLAWRSLWRNRRRTLITLVTIALGLGLATLSLALGEGMYAAMISQAVRMNAGQVVIQPRDYAQAPAVDLYVPDAPAYRRGLAAIDGVAQTKVLVLGQGMARSAAGAAGVGIVGVEPTVERAVSPLARDITAGQYLAGDDGRQVVIGEVLARRLGLQVGKKLVITTNDAQGQLSDQLCRVKGVFATGSEEVDGYLVQCDLGFARELFHLPAGAATQVGAVLADPNDQARVLAAAQGLVGAGPEVALDWREVLPELAAYIRLDRGSNWVFQALLIFLVLFTIFNTLLMSVLERRREFAVLLALGTSPARVRAQVWWETVLLGLMGTAAGLVVGKLASLGLDAAQVDLGNLYSEQVTISGFAVEMILRARADLGLLGWLGGLVFLAVLVMGLLPMQRATRMSVVDQLRQGA